VFNLNAESRISSTKDETGVKNDQRRAFHHRFLQLLSQPTNQLMDRSGLDYNHQSLHKVFILMDSPKHFLKVPVIFFATPARSLSAQ